MPAKSAKKPVQKLVTASPVGLGTRELAAMLGVDPSVVTRWKAEGCPHLPDGRYLASAVFAWREDRLREKYAGGDKEAEQIRKLRAEADRVEIEVAEARGQLIPVSVVSERLSAEHDAVRAAMVALPQRYARYVSEQTGCDMATALAVCAHLADGTLAALHAEADEDA